MVYTTIEFMYLMLINCAMNLFIVFFMYAKLKPKMIFKGVMSNGQCYDRCLSPQEVKAIYEKEKK